MAVYLSHLAKPAHSNGLASSASFLANNKITVNNPVQTHYTVEGVQIYNPLEIKALKEKAERVTQPKQGVYVPTRVVLLSDEVIDDGAEGKKQKEIVKNVGKDRPASRGRPKSSVNVRNAASTNNQVVVKLEKQINNKNVLMKKLQKMMQREKQQGKNQGLLVKEDPNDNIKQQQNQSEAESQQQQQDQQTFTKSNTNFDKTTHQQTIKTKNKAKQHNRDKYKKPKIQQQLPQQKLEPSEEDKEQSQFNQSNNISDVSFQNSSRMRKSTYSEKLGGAILGLFQ